MKTARCLVALLLTALALLACARAHVEITPEPELLKKAEAGDAKAQTAVAEEYYNNQDYEKAIAWFSKAANQGDVSAQRYLGEIYETGYGVPQDYKQAVAWYSKAANQGELAAQWSLGSMYYHGRGVPQDDKEAVAWFTKAAANKGEAVSSYKSQCAAQEFLNRIYDEGRGGVPQDEKEALAWYSKRAYQGDAYAQNTLGMMYVTGQGVAQDFVTGCAWIYVAQDSVPNCPRSWIDRIPINSVNGRMVNQLYQTTPVDRVCDAQLASAQKGKALAMKDEIARKIAAQKGH